MVDEPKIGQIIRDLLEGLLRILRDKVAKVWENSGAITS